MSCNKQEIERKRLAAIQKRQSKFSNSTQNSLAQSFYNASPPAKNNVFHSSPSSSGAGPSKPFGYNTHQSFHPYEKTEATKKPESSLTMNTKVISGTIYLISEERFEVNPSEFCGPLINIFKTIPSKSYDSKTKLWNFSIDDYQTLMSKVVPLAPHVVLGALPSYILKLLNEPIVDPNTIDITPIESTLRNKLMPFQQDGVRFGIAKRGRCMIADDMGLGKTFQALAIASYYKHNWPLLIVTTSSMRETWQSKIHELLPSVPMMNIATLTNGRDSALVADRQTEVVIVSYKISTMYTQLLKDKKFGVVIIDESHYLKSRKARCTAALGAAARGARRVLLLSGTPALSRPAELYTQLAIIDPQFFRGGFTDYGKRYCAGKLTNFGWDMTGQSNLTELQILLQRKFLIRRTKEQVLTKLQDKTRESVMLDESLLQFSKEDRSGLTQLAAAYVSTKPSEKHSALLSFFNETARVKIPAICKYIAQMIREETCKFLIFAHHKNMIDAICWTLDEQAVPYICIVGATPAASRADLVDKFQFSEPCRCAVLSITAASSGLTLTAAQLVIFAELHWNPGILTQAEARAHRLGQRGGVRVRYLLARGSADDCLWPMLQGKLTILNNVGLSKDSFEDATVTLQGSKCDITQYFGQKNANDYIPGTNIKKDSLNSNTGVDTPNTSNHRQGSGANHKQSDTIDDLDKSFLDDNEGDELLATLDL